MSDFVEPDVTRLDLSGDRWVEVKSELDYGETQQLAGFMIRSLKQGGDSPEYGVDWGAYNIAKIALWVTDWNLADATGKTLPVTKANISRLRPTLANEILTAIDRHTAEVQSADPNPSTPPTGGGRKSRPVAS